MKKPWLILLTSIVCTSAIVFTAISVTQNPYVKPVIGSDFVKANNGIDVIKKAQVNPQCISGFCFR